MFRNYLITALRNLVRNRLYASINVAGLATAFAAALLIGLFARNEYSYDKWIPGYEHIYRLSQVHRYPGQAPFASDLSDGTLAEDVLLEFPQVEEAARLAPATLGGSDAITLRHGDVESVERHFLWGDANLFKVLPLRTIAGDADTALARPDGIVITRQIARKYFGRDAPIGETIDIGRSHVMTVTAVLDDLPSNTHLAIDVIASGRAEFSELAKIDARESSQGGQAYTYLRMTPAGSVVDLQRALPAFIDRHMAPIAQLAGPRSRYEQYLLLPVADIHLHSSGFGAMKPSGSIGVIQAVSAVGVLIVLIAGVNFVNLTTVLASRRAVEVGVRKASGALTRDLIVQFVGESLIYVSVGAMLAYALAWVLLPTFNAFLDRTVAFDLWRDGRIASGVLAITLIAGILSGTYPAQVLSRVKPAVVLKGITAIRAPRGVGRALVVFQFAILIGLVFATTAIYRQTAYALNAGLRLQQDQVLLIDRSVGSCNDAFKDQVLALPGVASASCSDSHLLGYSYIGGARNKVADNITVRVASIDSEFFNLYGFTPLAGRLLSTDRPADVIPANKDGATLHVVINMTASRKLGFRAPEDAIGQTTTILNAWPQTAPLQAEIVGVVPDFITESVAVQVEPTTFVIDPSRFGLFSVKLKGWSVPETLRAIDQLWKRTGDARPIQRVFLDRRIQERYLQLSRQTTLFTACAAVALFVACIGLFGLSAFTAERRTKEIGIRKSIGASKADILRLILWGSAKPVLWANVIAWPIGVFVMHRWLQGFAYHVDLSPWMLLVASALALVVAVLTVIGHALRVARAKPVAALRYE